MYYLLPVDDDQPPRNILITAILVFLLPGWPSSTNPSTAQLCYSYTVQHLRMAILFDYREHHDDALRVKVTWFAPRYFPRLLDRGNPSVSLMRPIPLRPISAVSAVDTCHTETVNHQLRERTAMFEHPTSWYYGEAFTIRTSPTRCRLRPTWPRTV